MAGTADRLRGYMPPIYAGTGLAGALLDAVGGEFDALRDALASVLDQFFADTATWSLPTREAELGLPVNPFVGDDERRARVVARLRGQGTTTHEKIVNVANAFVNGRVLVIEDFAAYKVTLRFVDVRGVPPHVDQVVGAVEAIIPAHLELDVQYSYVLWRDVDAQRYRWSARPAGDTTSPLFDALNITFGELPTFIPAGG